MNVLDIFNTKKEKDIGSIECNSEELVETFLKLAEFLHMVNPVGIVTTTSKGISIKKKESGYVLVLHNYTPPVEITWSDLFNKSDLEAKLLEASKNSSSISFVNDSIDSERIQLAFC